MNIRILTFLCAFTGVFFTASGQTGKNSWLIGGNGSFNFTGRLGALSNHYNYKQFDASLSPAIGFFLLSNLTVGVRMPLSTTITTDYDSYSIGAGPFIRYYWGKGRIKVFPEVKVDFNWMAFKFNQPTTGFNKTSRSTTYAVGPGITYFIANNIALEGVFNFYTTSGSDTRDYINYIIDRQGIKFNIGLQIYLPNKQ